MTILTSIREGFRRVRSTPRLIFFLWLVNFAMAIPLALVMTKQIQSSIGTSLVHENLQAGFDIDWYEEFNFDAGGLPKTFSPAVIGIGAFIENLDALLNESLFEKFTGIVAIGIAFALIWMFFLGGTLDHFARNESSFSMERFLGASGRYFLRFLCLAITAGVLYYLVYKVISPRMFAFVENITSDVTAERTILLWTVAAYLIIAFLLVTVNMAFDYAKISTVLKDQRNVLAAFFHGFRFILANPGKTFGLYSALGVAALLFLGIYSLIAPGAGQSSSFTIILAFLVGQIYLVIKLIIRLTFYSGQMSLYESMTEAVAVSQSTLSRDAE